MISSRHGSFASQPMLFYRSDHINSMKKETVTKILDLLEYEYPEAECALIHKNIFELLIAVTLSAQTTDKSVNSITSDLFSKYPTPALLAMAPLEDIENTIKRIGLYKNKSKNIRNIAISLNQNFDGKVPNDYDSLVALPGVGRKTANVVLSVGFGVPRIAVDTHVFRVTNRIGLVNEKNVLKTELALMETIPEDRWSKAHHSFIFHGRNCCHARNPKCQDCVLEELCEKKDVC